MPAQSVARLPVPFRPRPAGPGPLAGFAVGRVAHADLGALVALCDEQAGPAAGGPAGRRDTLELEEALFDPPVRLWAWIARIDGAPVGYAAGSAGCALPERANYFGIESLYVRPGPAQADVERGLFLEALRMARRMGCLNLQWRLPECRAARLRGQLPPVVTQTPAVHYVLPLTGAA